MANRSRDKIFELVELKKPLKPFTAAGSEGKELNIITKSSIEVQPEREHHYQGLVKHTLLQDKGYEDTKKPFLTLSNNDSVELKKGFDLTPAEKENAGRGSEIHWTKKIILLTVFVGITALLLGMFLAALVLAVINKDGLTDHKSDTIGQFLAMMKKFDKVNETFMQMNDNYEALLDQVAMLKNDINRLHEMYDILSNETTQSFNVSNHLILAVNGSIQSLLQNVTAQTRQISNNSGSIRTERNRINSIISSSVGLQGVVDQLRGEINLTASKVNIIQFTVQGINETISLFSIYDLLANCTSNTLNQMGSITDSFTSKDVSVSAHLTVSCFVCKYYDRYFNLFKLW